MFNKHAVYNTISTTYLNAIKDGSLKLNSRKSVSSLILSAVEASVGIPDLFKQFTELSKKNSFFSIALADLKKKFKDPEIHALVIKLENYINGR